MPMMRCLRPEHMCKYQFVMKLMRMLLYMYYDCGDVGGPCLYPRQTLLLYGAGHHGGAALDVWRMPLRLARGGHGVHLHVDDVVRGDSHEFARVATSLRTWTATSCMALWGLLVLLMRRMLDSPAPARDAAARARPSSCASRIGPRARRHAKPCACTRVMVCARMRCL